MGQYGDALHHIPFTHDVIVNGSIPGCSSPHTIYSWCHCQRVNTGMLFTTYHLLMMSLSTGQYWDALHHKPFTHDVIVNESKTGCTSPHTIYSWCHCQRFNTGMPYTTCHLLTTGQHQDTNALHHKPFTHDVFVNLYLLNSPPPPPFFLLRKQKVFPCYKTPLHVLYSKWVTK